MYKPSDHLLRNAFDGPFLLLYWPINWPKVQLFWRDDVEGGSHPVPPLYCWVLSWITLGTGLRIEYKLANMKQRQLEGILSMYEWVCKMVWTWAEECDAEYIWILEPIGFSDVLEKKCERIEKRGFQWCFPRFWHWTIEMKNYHHLSSGRTQVNMC